MFGDTFDLLGHWRAGANRDAAEEAIRTGEPVKLGFLEKLYGGTTEDAQNIVNRQQQKALNDKYAVQFAQLGLTGADWGESEQQVLAKIGKRSEDRQAGQEAKARAQKIDDEERAVNARLKIGEQSIDAANDRFAFQHKVDSQRQAHQASESAKDRQLTRELNNSSNDLAMQMKFLEADLADKRIAYDRETRRLDRRQNNIAQLTKSLGMLGAAFAA